MHQELFLKSKKIFFLFLTLFYVLLFSCDPSTFVGYFPPDPELNLPTKFESEAPGSYFCKRPRLYLRDENLIKLRERDFCLFLYKDYDSEIYLTAKPCSTITMTTNNVSAWDLYLGDEINIENKIASYNIATEEFEKGTLFGLKIPSEQLIFTLSYRSGTSIFCYFKFLVSLSDYDWAIFIE